MGRLLGPVGAKPAPGGELVRPGQVPVYPPGLRRTGVVGRLGEDPFQVDAHASAGIYSIVMTARGNGLKTYEYLEWVLSEMPRAEAAGELDPARFLPWSPDVPERCLAPRDEAEAVFEDEPLVDIDPHDYEEVAG